ncbi:hypothetical protein CH63R_02854 [Colletotrichum higginsianum IMI 349063]|uniref:Aga1 a-agglutinin anchor subunit n=1 Tax=Colletotrichum higginsianum (strain IMI 349063) TaxID=759273 RepID=A0A1B7YQF5_COLHI|nr:hypothetical protein CH63R_02854 [Colletotrichum higginsianum IMI 349063]OBR14128.1 hypothetical protein CH63R_02854 [Colletotrichum higginsianum IMI 349063]
MSSSLARTRSLRKPTQGSSTDLPPTSTSNSNSTSTVNTAAAAPAPAPPTTSTQRPVSPSRLPAPRSLAATRPTTRSVSGASVASTKSGASDAAAAAAKKKRANPLSTLLSRPASTRQTPGTTSATRPRDAAAAAAAAAGGPPSAPPSRTNALSGLTRPSSTREPAPTRPRHPPAPSSSSSSTPAGAATGTRSTTATTRPTTSGGVPSSKLTSAASSATSSPTKGHARARSVATLNGSTILRPPGQPSASDRTTRSRPTSLYGGKHHRLVRAFERWASALPDLEAARARAEDQGDPEALLDADSQVRFGGALDARWKEDAAALVRKLEGWRAQLRELEYRDEEESDDDGGDGDGGKTRVSSRSSLERLLDGCGSLIKDMLDELAVMEEIEAVAVEREAEWIRRMNRQGEDGRGKDTPRAGAVWRVV